MSGNIRPLPDMHFWRLQKKTLECDVVDLGK
jgi:hypothetical protein